jgi:hypothetical protein
MGRGNQQSEEMVLGVAFIIEHLSNAKPCAGHFIHIIYSVSQFALL